MTDLVDTLLNADEAINAEEYKQAIKEYSKEVLNDKEKESHIKLTKKRIYACFRDEKYHDVLLDIEKLKELDVIVEDDQNLSSIDFESRFRTYLFKCVEELELQENKCKKKTS
ncbi:unnamed protein product [Rotaria sp. Silwood2]|nr:unnamed protein product [Rotaria sp. Silwood2]CAF3980100.1 unnamed protein product [Rotaria sp. Silwood2]